jgi:hypothetical protein
MSIYDYLNLWLECRQSRHPQQFCKEPIHIYDDRHSVLFAFKELFHSYARAYHIAKLNKKRLQMSASLKELLAAYRAYLQEKKQIIRVVG